MGLVKKTLVQVNKETGEEEVGLAVLVPIRQKLKEDFSMLTGQGLINLAMDTDIKYEDWRVLAVYLGCVEFENIIQISQKDVAEILEMKKQHVSRATKKLIAKNILLEETKIGRSKVYRLNTVYGWKGRINKTYTELYEKDSQLVTKIWKMKEKTAA